MAAHTLVITNDYPPRSGGIQTFIHELVSRFEPGNVTVLTSRHPGDSAFDADQSHEVVRAGTSVLLPTPATRRLALAIIERTGATQVVYGAMAPLGLLAPQLAQRGIERQVAISHGHEAGWAMTPLLRQGLRRIADHCDRVTFVSGYTRDKIAPALSPQAAARMRRLSPGVDTTYFSPHRREAGAALRREFGLQGPVIVCVSRLMKRKGQDVLIDAMPVVRDAVPGATLVIVGKGAYGPALQKRVLDLGLSDCVVFTGEVPYETLPDWYAAGDVFAMPCRTRNAGWDVEGLGIVYLEASATGLPVIAGDSGGAPDAVQDGVTGFIVQGRDVRAIQERLVALLLDSRLRDRLGDAGREWVEKQWTWDVSARRLQEMLAGWDVD